MSAQSQVVSLSEHRSKKLQQNPISVDNAGLDLSPAKKKRLDEILRQIIEISDNSYELIFFSAALASSIVQACQRAGCSSAPWHMADLYEKMMRDGKTET